MQMKKWIISCQLKQMKNVYIGLVLIKKQKRKHTGPCHDKYFSFYDDTLHAENRDRSSGVDLSVTALSPPLCSLFSLSRMHLLEYKLIDP